MNRYFTLLFLVIATLSFAQEVENSITMGPGYTNDIFYSLRDGQTGQYSSSSWTVAFYNSAMSAAIKINSGNGVALWKASDDVTQFASITDTSGISTWDQYFDNDSIWDAYSAFEQGSSGSQSSYGWGEYNFTSHVLEGVRIFVLKTIDNNYYKVYVEKKQAGVFTYRYASLDNSFDTTMIVPVPDYLEKSYAYLNMDNHTLQDREPVDAAWDFQFTKYSIDLPNFGYYPVTGVMSNEGVMIAEVRELPDNADYTNEVFRSGKTIIGSDWKEFNQPLNQFTLEENLTYFVKTKANEIYKLYFTDFEGSVSGNVKFMTEKVGTVNSIRDRKDNLQVESVYPNPTSGAAYLVLSADKNTTMQVQVFSMLGKVVYQANTAVSAGLNTFALQLQDVETGIYLVQVSDGFKTNTQKLVITK